jgi:CzcA family heavy metal efflux pump
MRWIVKTSLRYRYIVAGLAFVLLYFGVASLGQQKLDVFPEFAPVSVEIQTSCLGLSPAEVEQLTTIPLENALHGVPGVYDIRSGSEPQLSAIWLYFRSGTDELHARQLVQERLQATAHTLPTWCDAPQMYPIVSATSRVMQVGITSKTTNLMDLSTIAQYDIRPKLMAVPGVANVAIWGYRNREIMVEADPSLMAANNVPLDQLMSASADAVDSGELKYTNGGLVGSLGSVPGSGGPASGQSLSVRNIQPIVTPAQMANVPLGVQGKNGKPLRIDQVANVTWDYPTLAGDAVINGGPGLMLVIEKFPDANTLDVTNGIDRAFAQLQPGLKGITVDTGIFRQASFIQTAIHNLTLAVVIGCILVVFVLFLFLFQWRAALVSLLAIPLSLSAAAIVLDLMHTTINTMILAGFAVAVGVVVDDAIIDMENIVRRLRAWRAEGHRTTPLSLVLAASMEVRVAIWYATLINIVAVVPVMVVGGLTGAFFQPLAIAYSLAVLASMLVALTVTPALGLMLMSGARLGAKDPLLMRGLKRGYAAMLRPLLGGGRRAGQGTWRAVKWGLPALVALLIVGGAVVYPHLGENLFPNFKEPDFLMHFVTKPGTSVQEQDRMVANLQDQVRAVPGVTDVGSHIGQALLGEEVSGVNFSETWLSLSPNANYAQVESQLRNIATSYPGAFSDVQTYLHERIDEVLTNGTTEDVAVYIEGPDINTLASLGNSFAAQMAKLPGLDDVQPAPLEFVPEADVQVNVAAAAKYGLSPGDVRRIAAVMMASEPVSTISTNNILINVAVWSTPATRNSLQDLEQLPIDTATGGHVALGKIAKITLAPTPSQIIRNNNVRMTEVDANVAPGYNLSSVSSEVKALMARQQLPAGYTLSLQGEILENQTAQRHFIDYGLAALIVILVLLQVAFRSWRLAFMILLTLPMALVGGVLAAWGTLGTITLGALVGFFTVLGIAARNAILLVAHFRHLEEEEGMSFGRDLVIKGAMDRLAPILMTALATALALAALVVNGNRPGQEIEYPMAVVILGGLATATLLNLFVIPVLYLAFGKKRERPGKEGPAEVTELAPAGAGGA